MGCAELVERAWWRGVVMGLEVALGASLQLTSPSRHHPSHNCHRASPQVNSQLLITTLTATSCQENQQACQYTVHHIRVVAICLLKPTCMIIPTHHVRVVAMRVGEVPSNRTNTSMHANTPRTMSGW